MGARIEYKASVEKDLRKLGPPTAKRVLDKIEASLIAGGHQGEALSGEFAGLFRLRVGDYRIVYARISDGYLVLRVAHLRDVYRKGPD